MFGFFMFFFWEGKVRSRGGEMFFCDFLVEAIVSNRFEFGWIGKICGGVLGRG